MQVYQYVYNDLPVSSAAMVSQLVQGEARFGAGNCKKRRASL